MFILKGLPPQMSRIFLLVMVLAAGMPHTSFAQINSKWQKAFNDSVFPRLRHQAVEGEDRHGFIYRKGYLSHGQYASFFPGGWNALIDEGKIEYRVSRHWEEERWEKTSYLVTARPAQPAGGTHFIYEGRFDENGFTRAFKRAAEMAERFKLELQECDVADFSAAGIVFNRAGATVPRAACIMVRGPAVIAIVLEGTLSYKYPPGDPAQRADSVDLDSVYHWQFTMNRQSEPEKHIRPHGIFFKKAEEWNEIRLKMVVDLGRNMIAQFNKAYAPDQEKAQPAEKEPRETTRMLRAVFADNEIVADGTRETDLLVWITDHDENPIPGAVVTVRTPDAIEPLGPFAANQLGELRVRCRIREILRGESVVHEVEVIHSFPASDGRKEVRTKARLKLLPALGITVELVDMAGRPVADDFIALNMLNAPPSLLPLYPVTQTVVTGHEGTAFAAYAAGMDLEVNHRHPMCVPKRKNVTTPCAMRIIRMNPDTVTDEVRAGFVDFLRRAGIPEDVLKKLMETPVLFTGKRRVVPHALSRKVKHIELAQPERNANSILYFEKDFAHELGHWLSMTVIDPAKVTGGDHEGMWRPASSRELAFEEGLAHFVAAQYISTLDRVYDPSIEPGRRPQNITAGQADLVQGAIAAFLNQYYAHAGGGAGQPASEDALRDFMDTVSSSETPARTIGAFIKAKRDMLKDDPVAAKEFETLVGTYGFAP